MTTVELSGFPHRFEPYFVVFAAAFFVYSLDRVIDQSVDERSLPTRVAFIRRYGKITLAIAAALYVIATLLVGARHGPLAGGMLLPPVAIGFYSLGGLKQFLLIKNLIVGLCWGLIPVGVGIYYGDPLRSTVLILAAWVTVMLTIAAVVFDIKDVASDRPAGVWTLPVVCGPATTRRFAHVANALVAAVISLGLAVGFVAPSWVPLLVYHAYVAGYILAATVDRGPLFYGFVIDGEHVLLAVLILLIS